MVLGGHVSHLKSVIIYSRDSLALPLQKMSNMLKAIRDGSFQPDNTRSGRFVEGGRFVWCWLQHFLELDW